MFHLRRGGMVSDETRDWGLEGGALFGATHLKDSNEVALRRVRSMRVFMNFPQLTLYR